MAGDKGVAQHGCESLNPGSHHALNRAVTEMDSAWDEAAKRRRAAREKRRSRRSGDASAEAGASADAHAETSHADDTESTDEDAQD